MAELVVKVTVPDDDSHVVHYGVDSWVEGVLQAIEGDDVNNAIEVVSASSGPAGHACPICGGAKHGRQRCGPGKPPQGVPYMECCHD